MTTAIDRLRELRCSSQPMTPLQRVVLDAYHTHDPDAIAAAEELEKLMQLALKIDLLLNDDERR